MGERRAKKSIVAGIIFALLLASFFLIFVLQKRSLALKGKYPSVDCNQYAEEHKGRYESWKRDAINEYKVNTAEFEKLGQTHFTGAMQCFCD